MRPENSDPDLAAICSRILKKIQGRPVSKETSPLGIEADQIEIIFHPAASLAEAPSQDGRHGQNSRSHVETEAVPLPNRLLCRLANCCVRIGRRNSRALPGCRPRRVRPVRRR